MYEYCSKLLRAAHASKCKYGYCYYYRRCALKCTDTQRDWRHVFLADA